MGSGTPQWLYGALDDALVNLDATAQAAERNAEIDRVLDAWDNEGRPFHSLRYLARLFEKLDELDGPASDSDLLRLAMTYRGVDLGSVAQDSVSQLGTHSNMFADSNMDPQTFHRIIRDTWAFGSQSFGTAADAGARLEELGLKHETVERLWELVWQVQTHHPISGDLDGQILIDADLTIFATPPQQYRHVLESLQDEVPSDQLGAFLKTRYTLLRHLLERPTIFLTPVGAAWEETAHENIEAEMAGIEKKLGMSPNEMMLADVSDAPADHEHPTYKEPGIPACDSIVIRTSVAKKQRSTQLETDLHDKETSPANHAPEQPGVPERAPSEDVEADEDFASTSTLEAVADIIENIRREKRDRH